MQRLVWMLGLIVALATGCASQLDVRDTENRITKAIADHDANMHKEHAAQGGVDPVALKKAIDEGTQQLQKDVQDAQARLKAAQDEQAKLQAGLDFVKQTGLSVADLFTGGRISPIVDKLQQAIDKNHAVAQDQATQLIAVQAKQASTADDVKKVSDTTAALETQFRNFTASDVDKLNQVRQQILTDPNLGVANLDKLLLDRGLTRPQIDALHNQYSTPEIISAILAAIAGGSGGALATKTMKSRASGAVAKLSSKVQSLSEENDQQNLSLQDLQSKHAANAARLQDLPKLTEQNDDQNEKLAQLAAAIKALQGSAPGLQTPGIDLQSIKQQLSSISSALSDRVGRIEQEVGIVAGLPGAPQSIEKRIDLLQTQVAGGAAALDAIRKQLDKVQASAVPTQPKTEAQPEGAAGGGKSVVDLQARALLDSIYAKVNQIDGRLAAIEQRRTTASAEPPAEAPPKRASEA